MPIKFVNLFQDSWNFVRNRLNFTLYAVGLLTVLQVAVLQMLPRVEISPEQLQQNPEIITQTMLGQVTPLLLSSLVLVFVNVLLILNIKSINNGSYQHFFQNTGEALQRFLIAALLTFLQLLPLSIGGSFLVLLGSGALIGLPLLVTGLYVFVKFNLIVYYYLLEPKQSLGQVIKGSWTMSRGKMLPLILFSALIYIIPSLVGNLAHAVGVGLGNGLIGSVATQFINAFVNLFIVIFSFRFYQVYREFQGQK